MRLIISILCVLCLSCGAVEQTASSPSVVDQLGLDFSACVGGGFDTCTRWLETNIDVLVEYEFELPPDDVFLLDYTACLEDHLSHFDVCWEFWTDNSEKLWGWHLGDEFTETEFLTEIDSDG